MIQLTRIPCRSVPALALALLSLACASTDKGSATSNNITTAANEIQVGIGELDATMAALTSLVNQPAADLEPQFKAFSQNLDKLDKTAGRVRAAAAKMEENGKAYFAEWDKQIAAMQNEDIRERSTERREKVEEALADIKEDYSDARDNFQPLMNDLKDIRTALEADLTMDGIDSIKKTVKKASSNAEDVKEPLQDLADAFREVGIRLSKAGPAPAAK